MTVTLHAPVDTRRALDLLGPGSVDFVTCSPPFLALRAYGTGSTAEIGQEGSPAAFLAALLELTDMWGELLTPHGSIAIELGDTFSSSGGTVDNRPTTLGGNDQVPRSRGGRGPGWPLAKSLCLLPTLYAGSLAYGRNLLTGWPCTQWRVRNQIVWARPNPAVGALGDKVRPATSYITVATRSARRWFDLDAVRVKGPTPSGHPRGPKTGGTSDDHRDSLGPYVADPAGAPPLDYWTDEHDEPGHLTWEMTTQGSSIAHYAMWPPALADRLVRLMCPAEVCRTCGDPRRRVTGPAVYLTATGLPHTPHVWGSGNGLVHAHGNKADGGITKVPTTLGWSDCGHGDFRHGVTLDPFAGAGTTLACADLAGRDAIGIELNANAHDLYAIRRAEVTRKLYSAPTVDPSQASLFDLPVL